MDHTPKTFVDEILENRGSEVELMHKVAQLVHSGLDRKILAVVLDMLEHGVHPESIADGKSNC